MNNNHYDLYHRYFSASTGRFYNDEHRRRLLALLALYCGIDTSSHEFAVISGTVDTVEANEICDLGESKNYQLMCEISSSDSEESTAARALTSVYEYRLNKKIAMPSSRVEWILALRSERPVGDGVRMELVHLDYTRGDLPSAMSLLREMIEGGSFDALAYLAFIAMEAGCHEESYYYLRLLAKVYETELMLEERPLNLCLTASVGDRLSPERRAELDRAVAAKGRFLGSSATSTIGFGNGRERRFVYEY